MFHRKSILHGFNQGLNRRTFAISLLLTNVVAFLAMISFPVHAQNRMTSNELQQLRGTNDGKTIGTFTCDDITQGLLICDESSQSMDPCTTCEFQTFKDTGSTSGGYQNAAGNPQDCGTIFNGLCLQSPSSGALECFLQVGGDTQQPCGNPPNAPAPQPGDPPPP